MWICNVYHSDHWLLVTCCVLSQDSSYTERTKHPWERAKFSKKTTDGISKTVSFMTKTTRDPVYTNNIHQCRDADIVSLTANSYCCGLMRNKRSQIIYCPLLDHVLGEHCPLLDHVLGEQWLTPEDSSTAM